MQRKFFKVASSFLFLALCIHPMAASADVFMKQRHHTDGFQMMGQAQPARDSIQSIWMTADKARSDNDRQSIILRLDTGMAYILDHSQKSYHEMPMDGSRIADQMGKDKPVSREERASMGKMAQGMMKMDVTVTETGEKRRIGDWNCRKYLQTVEMAMGPSSSEVWATEDIKVDQDLYARFSGALLGSHPGAKDNMESLVREMKKIKGVPVLTISTANMMNSTVKSTMELLEFKEGKAPAGIFELPQGYSKREMMAPEEGGGRRERRRN